MDKNKVIIFDMDNTIVRSKIDFGLMRSEVNRFLDEAGIEHEHNQPVSHILQSCQGHPAFSRELSAKIWARIGDIEAVGMENADLEPGADYALERLSQDITLMLLSNNRRSHMENALHKWGLAKYFAAIAGRDMVEEMKPKPHGYLYLRNLRKELALGDFLAVGDATIDIYGASEAGIPFVAYNGSRKEDWDSCLYSPIAYLEKWDEKACDILERQLFASV